MSLEVTSKVTQETATGYDQITGETSVTTPNLTKTTYNRQEGKTERNLTSESTADGSKKNESEQDSNSERKVNSKTKTSRASVEKANIAFTLSFSIPLTGIIPTGSKSNC
jgi:hypothetical protein